MTEQVPHNGPERRKDDIRIEHRFTSLEKDRDFIMDRHREVLGRLDGMGKYLKKIKEDVCNSVSEIADRVTDALVKIGTNELAIKKIKDQPGIRWERWKKRITVITGIVVVVAGLASTAYYIYRMVGQW